MIELSNYSLADLRALQSQVAEQITARQTDEIRRAQQQILDLAKSVGMTVEQIVSAKPTQKKREGGLWYQHPEDASKTWTGRGRKPKWLQEFLDSGKELKSFLVN